MDLLEKINDWDSEISTDGPTYPKYNAIYEGIIYKEKKFFKDFTPATSTEHLGFWDRLENWVANVEQDDDQKALFEFVLSIHFISHEDMVSLFTSALNGPISRWIIDLRAIEFDHNLNSNLDRHLFSKTWYASLTDMNIGDFYRANNIQGIKIRPDFNTLVELGDDKKLEKLITDQGYKQLVLIEDFIGSGLQFSQIVKRFPDFLKNFPILFVPQIICSDGLNKIADYLKKYSAWKIEPVLIVDKADCLYPGKNLSDSVLLKKIIEIGTKKFIGEWAKHLKIDISKFDIDTGLYGCGRIGALIVLYTNTPDNTMPLIWKKIEDWNALFPRSSREG
jgi:hypothetical protein